jgi:hypothetical protein
VANSRADRWNRPPIDRMANLTSSRATRRRRPRRRHRQQRIDDQLQLVDRRLAQQVPVRLRARVIENSQVSMVKNPNYRGISAQLLAQPRAGRRADTVQVWARRIAARASPRK